MPVLPVLKELRMPGNRKLFGQVKSGTQSLKRSVLEGCEDLAQPRLEDDNQMRAFYGSLRSLEIDGCNWLFSVPQTSEAPLGFWKSLTYLRDLTIWSCDALFHWPEVEFQDLISLKSLEIYGCPYSPSPSPGERGILPQLETQNIDGAELVQLPKCPASLRTLRVNHCYNLKSLEEGLRHAAALESMSIFGCPSLTSLPTQLGHYTGLKNLTISICAQLSSLPEGLEGLTALQYLEVGCCPSLTSFPDGLQKRLPRLEELIIRGCPSLERRCKEGGEYWHLVSGIRCKAIMPCNVVKWSFPTGIVLGSHPLHNIMRKSTVHQAPGDIMPRSRIEAGTSASAQQVHTGPSSAPDVASSSSAQQSTAGPSSSGQHDRTISVGDDELYIQDIF